MRTDRAFMSEVEATYKHKQPTNWSRFMFKVAIFRAGSDWWHGFLQIVTKAKTAISKGYKLVAQQNNFIFSVHFFPSLSEDRQNKLRYQFVGSIFFNSNNHYAKSYLRHRCAVIQQLRIYSLPSYIPNATTSHRSHRIQWRARSRMESSFIHTHLTLLSSE